MPFSFWIFFAGGTWKPSFHWRRQKKSNTFVFCRAPILAPSLWSELPRCLMFSPAPHLRLPSSRLSTTTLDTISTIKGICYSVLRDYVIDYTIFTLAVYSLRNDRITEKCCFIYLYFMSESGKRANQQIHVIAVEGQCLCRCCTCVSVSPARFGFVFVYSVFMEMCPG